MFVGWEQTQILKPQKITLEALQAMAQQGGEEIGLTEDIIESCHNGIVAWEKKSIVKTS